MMGASCANIVHKISVLCRTIHANLRMRKKDVIFWIQSSKNFSLTITYLRTQYFLGIVLLLFSAFPDFELKQWANFVEYSCIKRIFLEANLLQSRSKQKKKVIILISFWIFTYELSKMCHHSVFFFFFFLRHTGLVLVFLFSELWLNFNLFILFIRPYLWHVEVPRLEIKPMPLQ